MRKIRNLHLIYSDFFLPWPEEQEDRSLTVQLQQFRIQEQAFCNVHTCFETRRVYKHNLCYSTQLTTTE